jgi:hypothetical protein
MDLVGTFEAHLILGVERSRLARWLSENEAGRRRIAEPVARLRSGPVWRRAQIEDKLRELAAEAGAPTEGPAFDAWALERSLARGKQAGLKPAEVEHIVRRQRERAAA